MKIIRILLCCFAAIGICLGSINAMAKDDSKTIQKSQSVKTSSVSNGIYPININKADAETLEEIKGIGSSKAEAIIKYRDENGTFETIDDLKNVRGIGQQFLDKIKDQITVGK